MATALEKEYTLKTANKFAFLEEDKKKKKKKKKSASAAASAAAAGADDAEGDDGDDNVAAAPPAIVTVAATKTVAPTAVKSAAAATPAAAATAAVAPSAASSARIDPVLDFEELRPRGDAGEFTQTRDQKKKAKLAQKKAGAASATASGVTTAAADEDEGDAYAFASESQQSRRALAAALVEMGFTAQAVARQLRAIGENHVRWSAANEDIVSTVTISAWISCLYPANSSNLNLFSRAHSSDDSPTFPFHATFYPRDILDGHSPCSSCRCKSRRSRSPTCCGPRPPMMRRLRLHPLLLPPLLLPRRPPRPLWFRRRTTPLPPPPPLPLPRPLHPLARQRQRPRSRSQRPRLPPRRRKPAA